MGGSVRDGSSGISWVRHVGKRSYLGAARDVKSQPESTQRFGNLLARYPFPSLVYLWMMILNGEPPFIFFVFPDLLRLNVLKPMNDHSKTPIASLTTLPPHQSFAPPASTEVPNDAQRDRSVFAPLFSIGPPRTRVSVARDVAV